MIAGLRQVMGASVVVIDERLEAASSDMVTEKRNIQYNVIGV